MSHFSVLVIRHPEQDLEALLQPFHEFECTGTDDQYVQDVDVTDEARKEYESRFESRYRDMNGKLHEPYEDEFYREPTAEEIAKIGPIAGSGCGHGMSWSSRDWRDGRGYRTKIHFLPEGWEEIQVATRDVESFAAWANDWYGNEILKAGERPGEAHCHGYIQLDRDGEVARIVKRTNPNAKWDWWVIGGRYSGKFAGASKVAPQDDPRNQERCFLCAGTGKRSDELGRKARAADPSYGCNGCSGTGVRTKFAGDWINEDNEIRVGDLDLAALKERTVGERAKWIAKIEKESGLSRPELETALRLDKEAHEEWLTLAEPRPRGGAYDRWIDEKGEAFSPVRKLRKACWWDKPDLRAGQSIEQWIAAAPPLTCFAVLKSGEWYERGEMGWWACVSNEKDQDAWESEVEKLLRDLDPDMILTVVDCHI
jgi:hypothetical protein